MTLKAGNITALVMGGLVYPVEVVAGGGVSPNAPAIELLTSDSDSLTIAVTTEIGQTVTLSQQISSGDWQSVATRTGSGNIVLTGLTSGTPYKLIATASVGDLVSEPSNLLIITLASDSAPDGDEIDMLADGLDCLLDSQGESVTYITASGVSRSIVALVKRSGNTGGPGTLGGSRQAVTVTVKNSATEGITPGELALPGDKLAIAAKVGGTLVNRAIVRIVVQNGWSLVLEVS